MTITKNKWTDEEKEQEILKRNFRMQTRHLPTWAEKTMFVVKTNLEKEMFLYYMRKKL